MESISKLFDSIIKAPLWVYLALALTSSAPFLSPATFARHGFSSNLRIGGIPIAFYATLFWVLFITSAAARSSTKVFLTLMKALTAENYLRKYKALSPEARFVLAAIEENQINTIMIPRGHIAAQELRDASLIEFSPTAYIPAHLGLYTPTMIFQYDLIYHRLQLRRLLRAPGPGIEDFAAQLRAANN